MAASAHEPRTAPGGHESRCRRRKRVCEGSWWISKVCKAPCTPPRAGTGWPAGLRQILQATEVAVRLSGIESLRRYRRHSNCIRQLRSRSCVPRVAWPPARDGQGTRGFLFAYSQFERAVARPGTCRVHGRRVEDSRRRQGRARSVIGRVHTPQLMGSRYPVPIGRVRKSAAGFPVVLHEPHGKARCGVRAGWAIRGERATARASRLAVRPRDAVVDAARGCAGGKESSGWECAPTPSGVGGFRFAS